MNYQQRSHTLYLLNIGYVDKESDSFT